MSSCVLSQLASINDFETIRKFLFAEETIANTDVSQDEEWSGEDWGDGWQDMEVDVPNEKEPEVTEARVQNDWVLDCIVSVSPNADYISMAHRDKIVFLQNKSPSSKDASFEISWKGILSENENEKICSVLILPLISLKQTSNGCCDWTCFVVSFSSGYFRVYAENGSQLFSQLFHDTPVIEMKCSTFDRWAHISHSGEAVQKDEVTVLHEGNTLVVIDGFSLFQTMRACRSQLAMASASGLQIQDPPPLSCQKWWLSGQQRHAVSHVSVAMGELCPFDRILQYSMDPSMGELKGLVTQYVTLGEKPFMSFYYAAEGNTRPILSQVASVVKNKIQEKASNLISAASGWIKWGTSVVVAQQPQEAENVKPAPKIPESTTLKVHSVFKDSLRKGVKIVVAPGKRGIAAVCDSLARVLLIDLNTRAVLRMWKGYREAQVGFIRAYDDTNHRASKKMALFLVIYAPRRGILEIWSCINGPRVGAFNINKNDRLLFPEHGMLGMTFEKSLSSCNMLQCCLLDSNSGSLKHIYIPFHLALSDSKSNKAHDIHLLKKVSQMLRSKQKDGNEVVKLITDMRLCSIQKQALSKLLHTKRIGAEIYHNCIQLLVKKYNNATKKEEKDFLDQLKVKMQLLSIYERICQLNESCHYNKSSSNIDSLGEMLGKDLDLEEHEMKKAAKLITSFSSASAATTVRFDEEVKTKIDAAEFLSCFSVNKNESDENCNEKYQIDLITDSTKIQQYLGLFLFHGCLFGDGDASELMEVVQPVMRTTAHNYQLLRVCILHWLEYQSFTYNNHTKLLSIVRSLRFKSSSDEQLVRHYNKIKSEAIVNSNKPLAAFICALVLRHLCRNMTNKQKSEDWDELCMDEEKWNLVVRKLEDSLAFNTLLLLGNKIEKHDEQKSNNVGAETLECSVEQLGSNGRGYWSEVIAEILSASTNIHPRHLTTFQDDQDNMSNNDIKFLDSLETCRNERLPFSLSTNLIHVNCFWKLMMSWNQNLNQVGMMSRALEHLQLVNFQPLVQRGVALVCWKTFILNKLLSLAKLVEKCGKAPKSRLCLKEVGMNDDVLSEFCGNSIEILQIIADSDTDQFPSPTKDKNFTDVNIESSWIETSGKESIVEIALKQPPVDYHVIQLFMNLLFVLRATMKFQLRGVKPLSGIFDQQRVTRKFISSPQFSQLTAMTSSADRDAIKMSACDHNIISNRQKLISSILEAVVVRMHKLKGQENDSADLKEWVDSCVEVSNEFNISSEKTHSNYVSMLYNYGLDNIACQEIDLVSDSVVLASELVILCGSRLKHHLSNVEPDVGVLLYAQMPTTLSTWLHSLGDFELKAPEAELSDTLELARTISRHLASDSDVTVQLPTLLVEAISAAMDA